MKSSEDKPWSLRRYATHRSENGLPGASCEAVRKAVASRRLDKSIALDAKGKPKVVDANLADKEWLKHTRPHVDRQPIAVSPHGGTPYEVTRANSIGDWSGDTSAETLIGEFIDQAEYSRVLVSLLLEHTTEAKIAKRLRPMIGTELPANILELLQQDVFAELDRREDEQLG